MKTTPQEGLCEAMLPPRRTTHEVRIGSVVIGAGYPVAVQSMTNVSTMDTGACVEQIAAIRRCGGRIVRLTAQGTREAENLRCIAEAVRERGLKDVALVADIHFRPDAALVAARYVDKVRINPGNYRDPDGRAFRELLEVCRKRGVAIRIGVNHGSLSDRIVEKWGDTPRGMVESAIEFLGICREENFDQAVVSMKSSNVRVMVEAYRLLAQTMDRCGMTYPLHLGVTEAGDGIHGRIKSAVGIGTLLAEGIGDTIRVSLTEPPENEISVGLILTDYFDRNRYDCNPDLPPPSGRQPDKPLYSRRRSDAMGNIGGGQPTLMFEELDHEARLAINRGEVAIMASNDCFPSGYYWKRTILETVPKYKPVLLSKNYYDEEPEKFFVKAAADFGPPLLDGLADAIRISLETHSPNAGLPRITALSIMQAARVRISHTEYIACPGCGRTLYDLQETLAQIRSRTEHLKGLKIGIMGCIVNGPGEMADADYGYVGEGAGKISLYKGRQLIRRGIAQGKAVEALVEVIKTNGDWVEPPVAD